jgi:hypothetical protein
MRVAVDCPDNALCGVSGSSLVRMWLEVSVGLGPKHNALALGWDVRLLVHKHRCGLLESVIQLLCVRAIGLVAESMPAESVYITFACLTLSLNVCVGDAVMRRDTNTLRNPYSFF